MFHAPEEYRYNKGVPATLMSSSADGNNGYFVIPFEANHLVIMCSDGMGWEHVSVSMKKHTPNWRAMCMVKDLFWDAEDLVVQYHPPKSEYVNNHENCLHLWRPIGKEIPLPPSILVGIKEEKDL